MKKPPKNDFKIQISISLPISMVSELDSVIKKMSMSRTEFIREATKRRMEEIEKQIA